LELGGRIAFQRSLGNAAIDKVRDRSDDACMAGHVVPIDLAQGLELVELGIGVFDHDPVGGQVARWRL
jgi:hypothetical protein